MGPRVRKIAQTNYAHSFRIHNGKQAFVDSIMHPIGIALRPINVDANDIDALDPRSLASSRTV